MPKILVCKGDSRYFLRIHLETRDGEIIRFDSDEVFNKKEADYRSMMLSVTTGFERDELPTHPKIAAYPKGN
jgi:hypothetical protein